LKTESVLQKFNDYLKERKQKSNRTSNMITQSVQPTWVV